MSALGLAALNACVGAPTDRSADRVRTVADAPVAPQDPAVTAPARPWSLGFAPAAGAGTGSAATLRLESYTIEIDDKDSFVASVNGDVDFDLLGFEYTLAAGACQVRLGLASVAAANGVTNNESDDGVLGGVAFAFPIARTGRFVWGGDAGFHGGILDWNQPAYGDTTIGWFQYDVRAGLAYAPSPTSRAGLAPRVALGVRTLDGVQDLGGDGTTDFDAVAPYALIGVGAHVRTGARSRLGFDLHGLVGDVQGIEFAISFQF